MHIFIVHPWILAGSLPINPAEHPLTMRGSRQHRVGALRAHIKNRHLEVHKQKHKQKGVGVSVYIYIYSHTNYFDISLSP